MNVTSVGVSGRHSLCLVHCSSDCRYFCSVHCTGRERDTVKSLSEDDNGQEKGEEDDASVHSPG